MWQRSGTENNDRLLLQTVKTAGGLAVTVDNGEGCAQMPVVAHQHCHAGFRRGSKPIKIYAGCRAARIGLERILIIGERGTLVCS